MKRKNRKSSHFTINYLAFLFEKRLKRLSNYQSSDSFSVDSLIVTALKKKKKLQ